MATASVQTVETFTKVSTPDLSGANPRMRSGLAAVFAGFLAAHRARQAAEVERALRQVPCCD
jgi:hypothetical protein